MKTFRTPAGPFTERPYYSNSEIDTMCCDELHSVGLLPAAPEPIRIDRFIEKRFGRTHDYDDLPPGILGYTRFSKSGVAQIVIARALDDNSTKGERRVRSTLAHEAGHGLLHSYLFQASGQSSLFPEGLGDSPRVLCRDERPADARKYRGEWWEYQANRAIGGFLVPRGLGLKALQSFVVAAGLLGVPVLPDEARSPAASHLARTFDVSLAVATIRLAELFPERAGEQSEL